MTSFSTASRLVSRTLVQSAGITASPLQRLLVANPTYMIGRARLQGAHDKRPYNHQCPDPCSPPGCRCAPGMHKMCLFPEARASDGQGPVCPPIPSVIRPLPPDKPGRPLPGRPPPFSHCQRAMHDERGGHRASVLLAEKRGIALGLGSALFDAATSHRSQVQL
jgi:hypothetical protein